MGGLLAEAMGAGLPGAERTIEDITRDVLREKERFARSTVQLGQYLIEAKDKLSHGEWLPWLRDRVAFTERHAQSFMSIAREFPNTKSISHLDMSKALVVIKMIPAAERETFINTAHEVDGEVKLPEHMSTNEVKKTAARYVEPETSAELTPKPPHMSEQQGNGMTRWDCILCGGVNAMAELLLNVREHPEQFQFDFVQWLEACGG